MKSGDVVPIRTRNLNEIKKEYYNYIEYRGNIAGTTKRLKIFYDKVGGDFEVVKEDSLMKNMLSALYSVLKTIPLLMN